MTTPTHPRVLLVSSPDDVATPWPLACLRGHLRRLGHEVTVTGDLTALGQASAGVDLIHAFGWMAGLAVADCDRQVPWILTAPWDSCPEDSGVTDAARGADLVLCSSSESADAANRLGVSHERCHVLPVGVDMDVFTRHGPSANRTTNQRIIVRAVGPGDGVLDVVAALRAMPGTELVILIGSAPEQAVERHHKTLLEAAQEMGVRDRVALVPTAEPLERAWMLRSADVVVSVAAQTGDHALVAEAMACGRAVVISPVGAQRDLVVNAVTGLHVPAARARALALTLRHLLAETFALEGMGLAGADRTRSRNTWPRVAHEFGSVYARIAGLAAMTEGHGDELLLTEAEAETASVVSRSRTSG